jgi:hypothetical protein
MAVSEQRDRWTAAACEKRWARVFFRQAFFLGTNDHSERMADIPIVGE